MELTQEALRLPAKEAPWAREVREDPRMLADIARAVGGPYHLLHPEQFGRNLREFGRALRTAGVDGKVYYGKKANKAACWLHECATADEGVDVASTQEFSDSLAHGIRGTDLMVTGAAKSTDLLWLAARHGSTVAIDALDELERAVSVARAVGSMQVLLRVLPAENPHSRFGFSPDELDRALERCIQERDHLTMRGFSFHLNGYEVAPRASLASELLDRCLAARVQGLQADAISIGGGFAVSYLEAEDWHRFLDRGTGSLFHGGKEFSHFYPYHQAPTGAEMLAAILAGPAGGRSATVGARFAQSGTRLLLEPGRALLDGAGCTVFPVQGFKPREDHGIITADGLSTSLSEQWKGSEFLPDPVLWPETGPGEPVRACVGGASCLDYDMLSWRKIPFPREPRSGDLLIYPNTAGYQMDKNESEFHQRPLPRRVVAFRADGRLQWRLDRP